MASTTAFGDANASLQAHTINGPVHASYHLSPGKLRGSKDPRARVGANSPALERPETPPRPLIVIPFARDADFVERGTILEDLHKRRAAPDSWTALVGLGGVGWVVHSFSFNSSER